MPVNKKKKFDPPTKVYVIFDLETKHPVVVTELATEAHALDGEVIQEYYLKERKKR